MQMIYRLLIALMFVMKYTSVLGQTICLSEGINFSSTSDINNFKSQYPDCTHIIGDVFVFTPLNSLEGLEQLKSIGGDLGICCNNWAFDDLEGLNNLESIGGYLHLNGLDGIRDISALSNLKSIGGELWVFNNDILENLDGLENVTSIGEHVEIQWNPKIKDLSGLENVTYVGGNILIDGNDELSNIDGFLNIQEVTKSYNIEDCPLLENIDGFAGIHKVYGYLSIRNNDILDDLTGLTSLVEVENGLTIRDNNGLTSLDALGNLQTVEGIFSIRNNDQLVEVGTFPTLTSVGGLEIGYNDELIHFNGMNALESVSNRILIQNNSKMTSVNGLKGLLRTGGLLGIWENISLLELDAFQNLTSIGDQLGILKNDTLQRIDEFERLRFILGNIQIRENRNLQSISGIQNINPVFIQFNSNYFGDIVLYDNPQLLDCEIQPICRILEQNGNNVTIRDNGTSCDDISDFMCSSNSISGIVFFDRNQNGLKDNGDYGIPNYKINLSSVDYEIATNANGRFSILADSAASYSLTIEEDTLWQVTSDSTQYNFIFQPGDSINNRFDFGVFPSIEEYSGQVSLSSEQTRCNTEVTFNLRIRNTSAFLINSRVDITLDPLTSFVSASEPLLSEFTTPTIVAIDGGFLDPYEYLDINLVLQMPSEQLTGAPLNFRADFYRDLGSSVSALDSQEYNEIVLCSYDPNDKLVSPNGAKDENYTLHDQEFTYTVRFQNTGNAEAIDVAIRDTISPYLDMSSLKIINASFFPSMTVEGNAVEFLFEDIYLPDSISNEALSHGYVTYRISPLSAVDDMSVIENTAHIIFDFNPAIITNTTSNTMVDSIGENVYVSIDTIACLGDTILGYTNNATIIDTTDFGPLCLLIETTNINFIQPTDYFNDIGLCPGESILINGEEIFVDTIPVQLIDTIYTHGCIDSVLFTNINQIPTEEIEEYITICDGEEYQGFTDTGVYEYSQILNGSLCPTLVYLNLQVIPSQLYLEDIEICPNEFYMGLNVAGVYSFDTINIETGCTDILQVNLSVLSETDPMCLTNTDQIEVDQISVIPNPFTNQLLVKGSSKINTVSMLDLNGQLLFTQDMDAEECILETSTLASGIYILKVIAEGRVSTQKVIKD